MEAFTLDIEHELEETQPKPAPSLCFAPPMSDSMVQQAKKFAVTRRTQKDTLWCISLWKEWRETRNSRSEKQQVGEANCLRYLQTNKPSVATLAFKVHAGGEK